MPVKPILLLKVKVLWHKTCTIRYRDADWTEREMLLEDDLSKLLQHECDHLDGILATQRVVDDRGFKMKTKN